MEFDFDKLKIEEKRAIIGKLSGHVTSERWALMEKVIGERTRHITVVLEDIYQAHNAGAVVRTCECMGVQDMYIIENRNPFNLRESQVAMGASKWVDMHYYQDDGTENSLNCVRDLKNKGYKVAGMTLGDETIPIADLPVDEPVALVIGTEKRGLSEIVAKEADYRVEIPMYGFTESFNLSVCAGISLSHMTAKLRESTLPWRLSDDERMELSFRWLSQCIKGVDVLIKGYLKDLRGEE